MVVGATCQQAAGKQMEMLKEVSTSSNSDIEFDTVVIDEAARANPLDLFIPMSMAKRRIVLVGDDRQLPHMLEPDIEGQLQEEHELTELQLAAFRSSLFERMRVKLQDLEKQDSIRRVVMLDTQFRMHPVLGNFVSKHFYECENLGFCIPAGRQRRLYSARSCFLGLGRWRSPTVAMYVSGLMCRRCRGVISAGELAGFERLRRSALLTKW